MNSFKPKLAVITLLWLIFLGLYCICGVLFVITQQTDLLPLTSILLGIDAWPYLLASAISFISAFWVFRKSWFSFVAIYPCLILTIDAWGYAAQGVIGAYIGLAFCLLPLVTLGILWKMGYFVWPTIIRRSLPREG